jgi:hypothetical protein
MKSTRAACIAVVASVLATATACSDGSASIAAPDLARNANAGGTWTSTIWRPTANGLQYVGTRTGRYRSTIGGQNIVDTGTVVHLDAGTVAKAEIAVTAEMVAKRLDNGGTAGLRASSGAGNSANNNTRRRPQFKNARIVNLGTRNGKAYALQLAVNAANPAAPASATIITEDGRAIGVRSARYRQSQGRYVVTHNTATLLDSASNASLVVNTDFDGDALQSLSALERARATLQVASDALASIVLPATLHAEDAASIPCATEMNEQLKAAAAWSVAAGALATGSAACLATGITCVALPFLTMTVFIADAALGIAIGNYAACMYNYNHPVKSPTTNGAGNSGGGMNCILIEWYESHDGGKTWKFVDSTYQCSQEFME